VNIAVQTVLDAIKKNPEAPLYDESLLSELNDAEQIELEEFVCALKKDPVGCACNLVYTCRSSGQCRNELLCFIEEENQDGIWKDETGVPYEIRPCQLLRDCPTWWSSTYMMGDRVIANHPVSLLLSSLHCRLAHILLLGYQADERAS
jgi:hypothetical protein